MVFLKSTVSVAVPMKPGSSRAQRQLEAWSRIVHRVEVTPDWIAENEAKQRAYEQQRREWRELTGIKHT